MDIKDSLPNVRHGSPVDRPLAVLETRVRSGPERRVLWTRLVVREWGKTPGHLGVTTATGSLLEFAVVHDSDSLRL